MLKWVIRGICVGAAAGGAYVLGERQGARKLADRLRTDRPFATAVLEKLASLHGAKLEIFEMGSTEPPKPPKDAAR
jgi:hypothetical protein